MTLMSVRPVDDAPGVDAPGVDAHEEFKVTMQKLSAKFGSMVSVCDMAHAPVVLGVYDRFQQALTEHGTFDARTREAVALAVAAVGNCSDCQFTYTVGCRAAGWTLKQTTALRTGGRIADEEKITTLLAVARQVAGNAGDVDEATWCHALQTGWTIEELAELFTHVIANIFTNYLYHFTRGEVDTSAMSIFHEASA